MKYKVLPVDRLFNCDDSRNLFSVLMAYKQFQKVNASHPWRNDVRVDWNKVFKCFLEQHGILYSIKIRPKAQFSLFYNHFINPTHEEKQFNVLFSVTLGTRLIWGVISKIKKSKKLKKLFAMEVFVIESLGIFFSVLLFYCEYYLKNHMKGK